MISDELREALMHAQKLARAEGRMDIFGVLNVLQASILMGTASELDAAAKDWVRRLVEPSGTHDWAVSATKPPSGR